MTTLTLKQKHDEFIAKVKAKGGKTLVYRTPCCNNEVEDRVPPSGEMWDSMVTCPHCDAHYFKTATTKKIIGKLVSETI